MQRRLLFRDFALLAIFVSVICFFITPGYSSLISGVVGVVLFAIFVFVKREEHSNSAIAYNKSVWYIIARGIGSMIVMFLLSSIIGITIRTFLELIGLSEDSFLAYFVPGMIIGGAVIGVIDALRDFQLASRVH